MAEVASINSLQQRLSDLTVERNRTNTSTQEGIKRFGALQKEIKVLCATIKESQFLFRNKY